MQTGLCDQPERLLAKGPRGAARPMPRNGVGEGAGVFRRLDLRPESVASGVAEEAAQERLASGVAPHEARTASGVGLGVEIDGCCVVGHAGSCRSLGWRTRDCGTKAGLAGAVADSSRKPEPR